MKAAREEGDTCQWLRCDATGCCGRARKGSAPPRAGVPFQPQKATIKDIRTSATEPGHGNSGGHVIEFRDCACEDEVSRLGTYYATGLRGCAVWVEPLKTKKSKAPAKEPGTK